MSDKDDCREAICEHFGFDAIPDEDSPEFEYYRAEIEHFRAGFEAGISISPTIHPTPVCGEALVEKILAKGLYFVDDRGGYNIAIGDLKNVISSMAGSFDAVPPAASMGDDKAVNKSTGQAALGIAPEAAGLEPRCDQPSPARSRDDWERVMEAIDATIKSGSFAHLDKRISSKLLKALAICERNLKE